MSDTVVDALRSGRPVILPTDTVYGLCADGYREAPALKLYVLKRRPESLPLALLAVELDVLLDAVPELRGRAAVAARSILPGPYTLVLPNPARRFRWLNGADSTKIGIRVPNLPDAAEEVVRRVGVIAATSANLHGEPDPARLTDVSAELRERVGAGLDAGELPGTPSTVIELTGDGPEVRREGAGDVDAAIERIESALHSLRAASAAQ